MSNRRVAFLARMKRQMLADFIRATGAERIDANELLDWIEAQPEDYPARLSLFGKDDDWHARQSRLQIIRGWLSDMRVFVNVQDGADNGKPRAVTILAAIENGDVERPGTVKVPLLVSERTMRTAGGGYIFAAGETAAPAVAEVLAQGLDALDHWSERYGGACLAHDIDLEPLRRLMADIAAAMQTTP
jgi:hypothetical protein